MGVEDSRCRFQRVDGGIDTELRNLTREHGGGVEEAECCGGSGVGKVVGRHVDSLYRGNRTLLCRGDTFLEGTHLRGKCGLVAYGRGHTTQKSRHLGTCLGETEDVVDKEEDVLASAILVAELLGDGKTGKSHTQTRARGLVHLSEHEGCLRLGHLLHVDIGKIPLTFLHAFGEFLTVFHNAALNHLAQQVVAFAGTLAHTGKHRESVVAFGDIVDKLHDEHRLSYAGTAEQTDFATLGVGFEKVDDLDTGIENLGTDGEIVERGGRLMDGAQRLAIKFGQVVDGIAEHVEQASLHLVAGRHRDRTSEILHAYATLQTVGTFHSHTSHGVLADVLLDFQDEVGAIILGYTQSRVNRRDEIVLAFEGDVDHRADHLSYCSEFIAHC